MAGGDGDDLIHGGSGDTIDAGPCDDVVQAMTAETSTASIRRMVSSSGSCSASWNPQPTTWPGAAGASVRA
jgi:hypothetical protein